MVLCFCLAQQSCSHLSGCILTRNSLPKTLMRLRENLAGMWSTSTFNETWIVGGGPRSSRVLAMYERKLSDPISEINFSACSRQLGGMTRSVGSATRPSFHRSSFSHAAGCLIYLGSVIACLTAYLLAPAIPLVWSFSRELFCRLFELTVWRHGWETRHRTVQSHFLVRPLVHFGPRSPPLSFFLLLPFPLPLVRAQAACWSRQPRVADA